METVQGQTNQCAKAIRDKSAAGVGWAPPWRASPRRSAPRRTAEPGTAEAGVRWGAREKARRGRRCVRGDRAPADVIARESFPSRSEEGHRSTPRQDLRG